MIDDGPALPLRNRLLARLNADDYDRLVRHMQLVPLHYDQPIYAEGGPIDYAYFPATGVISAVTTMADGTTIEVATIGNEGMAGLPALIETESSPNRLFVQVAGSAFRMPADMLRQEAEREQAVRKIFLLYQNAFLVQVSQSVACNGLHTVQQRCCRWLLITRDRVHEDVLPLTHELLSIMLGVRRQSVTEVL